MRNLFLKLTAIAAATVLTTGCLQRIETGSVGVRVDMSRQVQGSELPPGSWNQTIIGNVLTFPVKDLVVNVENKTPLTADNTALHDFDVTVVYNINPGAVAELFSTKSKSFHAYDTDGDTLLMYNLVTTMVNNAAYKTVRGYRALEVADNRSKIEQDILAGVNDALKAEGLDKSINVSMVQVRNIAASPEILKAATEFVKSQNELKIKENEVKIAEAEARRQKMLADTGPQTIAYMNAQSLAAIADGVKAGKVHAVVVPYDFKGIVNLPPAK